MQRLSIQELDYATPVRTPQQTNQGLPAPRAFFAQGTAKEALEQALRTGGHAYLTGPSGVGKRKALLAYLHSLASLRPTPMEQLYLPIAGRQASALKLGSTDAREFMQAIRDLLHQGQSSSRILGTTRYKDQRRKIELQRRQAQQTVLSKLREEAQAQGLSLVQDQNGLRLEGTGEAPSLQLEQQLDEDAIAYLELAEIAEEALAELRERSARQALRRQLSKLSKLFPDAVGYLEYLVDKLVEAAARGTALEDPEAILPNLIVEREPQSGAPVVYEPVSSYTQLFGCLEHQVEDGFLRTHVGLIRAGAVHRADGGFLVLDAAEVLKYPRSWEALKRTLKSGQAVMEDPKHEEDSRRQVEPKIQAMPVSMQVFLIGPVHVFDQISLLDEEFAEIFRFRVEFDPLIPAGEETLLMLAGLLARPEEGLPPFTLAAVGRLLDEGKRWVERADRTDARVAELVALAHEATIQGREVVELQHVEAAIMARVQRDGLLERFFLEELHAGSWWIETSGRRVGQVNALVLVEDTHAAFGRPVRITARVSSGREGVISIERETNLAGAAFSKAVLTLSGYLRGQYADCAPFAANISLVFEQQYEEIDGDSAGLAELLAALSALGGLALRQDLALTGAVDQHGRVLPVGGITTKVEGFYRAARTQGESKEPGVIIPVANVRNLILRPEVRQAVADGTFRIYTVEQVDEAFELMTGLKVDGYRGAHARVCEALKHLAHLEEGVRGEAEGRSS